MAGNVSPPSSPVTITIDTAAPLAPVITSPANGTITSIRVQSVSGTAEPGVRLEVFVDGTPGGITIADNRGFWSLGILPPELLRDGSHSITAKAIDTANNASLPSSPVLLTVDTTAPLAPVITSPANGTLTNLRRQIVSGTAEPGVTVEILTDGTSVGTTPASQDGSWSFSTPLTNGSHTITAKARDQARNVSPRSSASLLTVDTIAPTVRDTIPPNHASNVSINEIVKVTFTEPVDPSSFEIQTSFTIKDNDGNPVAGDVSLNEDGMKASFHLRFNSSLNYSMTYTAKVSPGVRDRAGNNLNAEHSWTFTTEKEPYIISPKVVSTDPADRDSGIPVNSIIIARFSKEMDPSTISVDTFTVTEVVGGSYHRIGGAVFPSPNDGKVWKFKPRSSLNEYTSYSAYISGEARDVAGNRMDSDYSWSFRTEQITPG